MSIPGRFNTMASLTVALGVLCYAFAEVTLPLPLVALVIIAWSWRRGAGSETGRPPAISPLIVNILVVTAITYSFTKVFVFGRHEAIVSDLSEFLVLIQVIKLFDRRTGRDDAQFLSLSLFIVIGAILTSNSLAFGLMLIAYVPAAIITTMLLQLHTGLLRVQETRRADGITGDPPVTGLPPMRTPFRRLTAGVVTSSVLLAGVLFFVVPRGIGDDAFGSFGKPPGSNTIGFSDEVRLGRAGLLSESPRPVLTVELFDANGMPIGSPDRTLYLRGTAQDLYNQETGGWTRTAEDEEEADARSAGRDWRPLQSREDSPLIEEQRIRLLRPNPRGGYLFTQWRPVEVKIMRSGYSLTHVPQPDRDDLVRQYRDIDPGPLVYLVRSIAPSVRAPVLLRTQPPGFQSGPIRALTERLIADGSLEPDPSARTPADNRAIANTFMRHLRSTCAYTLELEAPPAGREPIEWFLLDRRLGHCEYFASAMAAMCQSAGIPARVISGYVATEYDRATNRYMVRQSNAHAWVETSFEPRRWEQLDPTPPADLDRIHRASPGFLGAFRRAWERLEFRWTNSIVSFDEQRRKHLFGKAFGDSAGRFAALRETLEQRATRVLMKLKLRGIPSGLLGWLFSIGLLIALLLLLIGGVRTILLLSMRRRTRRADDDPQLKSIRAQLQFFNRAHRALARAGLPCPSWCPPGSFAAQLRAHDESLAVAFGALTDMYYKARFGRTPLTAGELESARALLADVESRASLISAR